MVFLTGVYGQSGPMSELYAALVENDRFLKNEEFSQPKNSPIPEFSLSDFEGLNYFMVDPIYKVKARLYRDENQEAVEVKLTNGESTKLIKYGAVICRVNGKVIQLSVFRDQNLPELKDTPGQFIIPFADATNGTETFPTGRYLTFKRPMDSDDFEIDFNTAFNPWCAYNTGFAGIIAPEENQVPFAIQAGEKLLRSTAD